MKSFRAIKESFQAQWDKRTGKEILMPGARVKVAHKGRMVVGKVIRYDKGGTGPRDFGVPFYVVDVGEYESKIVPVQDAEPLREAMIKEAYSTDTNEALKAIQTSLAKKAYEVENVADSLDRIFEKANPKELEVIQLVNRIASLLEDAEYKIDKLRVSRK